MWIIVAVTAYLLLALAALVDKYLLAGPIPNPKFYAFAIGVLGSVVFLLIPFGVLIVPPFSILLFGLLAGSFNVLALLIFFTGLQKFEASRIVPAIGGITPIFTSLLTLLLVAETQIFSGKEFAAFLLLVGGTISISMGPRVSLSIQSLLYATLAAFLFAGSVVFAKFVYVTQPFLSAVQWVVLGSFTTAIFFLLSKEVRAEVRALFQKKEKKTFSLWTAFLFWFNRVMGGGAVALQHLAVFLAPFGSVAFVHAMAGFQYAFLFILALALSAKLPSIAEEPISTSVVMRKTVSILLIGAGLALLAL